MKILIFFLFFLYSSVKSSNVYSNRFGFDAPDIYYNDSFLMKLTSATRALCLSECNKAEECLTVSYDSKNSVCNMFKTDLGDFSDILVNDTSFMSVHWKKFASNGESCREVSCDENSNLICTPTKTCTCNLTHVWSPVYSMCISRGRNETCNVTAPCDYPFTCINNICKCSVSPVGLPCPNAGIPFPSVSPRYCMFKSLKDTWLGANNYCLCMGMRLATSKNATDFRLKFSEISDAWVGFSYKHEDSQWYWITGTIFETSFWTNGEQGHKFDGKMSNICGFWHKSGSFCNHDCANKQAFICEFP